jgi:exopolysaccharide biosynthesis polyprenyl glycosylphosphotransferase
VGRFIAGRPFLVLVPWLAFPCTSILRTSMSSPSITRSPERSETDSGRPAFERRQSVPRPCRVEPIASGADAPDLEHGSASKGAKLGLGLADAGAVVLAEAAAWAIRNPLGELGNVDANLAYVLLFVLSPLVFLGAMVAQRLYSARCVARRPDELRRLGAAVAVGGLGLACVSFMLDAEISRGWVVLLTACSMVLLSLEREVARRVFNRMRENGRFVRPVLIVGANAEAKEIGKMFARSPELGYRTIGYLATPDVRVDDITAAMRDGGATGVVIAASAADLTTTGRLVRALTDVGVHVEVSSPLRDIASQRLLLRNVGRFPMTYVEPVHRSGWRQVAKRSFDVAIAGTALVLLSPVLAVVAAAVRLDSRGPALFRQERVGKDGERFDVVKFRTMVVDAEERLQALIDANEADGPLFKMRNDPRITRIGGFLRRSSLDELPQLWNVLRGDMSLVGPRPALPSEVDQWPTNLHQRLRVKPGITGMWQVHGRSSASFDEYERLDLYYVDNWSLVADLAILCKTVPAVVSSRGAY